MLAKESASPTARPTLMEVTFMVFLVVKSGKTQGPLLAKDFIAIVVQGFKKGSCSKLQFGLESSRTV